MRKVVMEKGFNLFVESRLSHDRLSFTSLSAWSESSRGNRVSA